MRLWPAFAFQFPKRKEGAKERGGGGAKERGGGGGSGGGAGGVQQIVTNESGSYLAVAGRNR